MRVGIYNEPNGGALGGSEVSVALLAQMLAREHEVEIIHRRPQTTREEWARFANVDLSNVGMRLAPDVGVVTDGEGFVGYFRFERDVGRRLSQGYDVFIAFVHSSPPYCFARRGVLMVLFPLEPDVRRLKVERGMSPWRLLHEEFRMLWLRMTWWSRLSGYRVRVANSQFTRLWTRKRWQTECDVVYPPVSGQEVVTGKENRILSVGRFSVKGHGKRQSEMLAAYGRLRDAGIADWVYDSVGGCGDSIEDRLFLNETKDLAAACGATVKANLSSGELGELYRSAKLFWHAAGLGEREDVRPEQMEHFGMTTAEAMAAGCVPVVIRKGGQCEIVEHGVNGFLWETLEELVDYSLTLIRDEALRAKMSEAAVVRSKDFSCEAYLEAFRMKLTPFGVR